MRMRTKRWILHLEGGRYDPAKMAGDKFQPTKDAVGADEGQQPRRLI